MNELSGYDALNVMFKELKIDSCTNTDIYHWRRDYNKRRPNVYVDTTRDVMNCISSHMYYWDYKNEIYYKQSYLLYPICDDIHYKFPENKEYKLIEKYYKLQKIHEKNKIEKSKVTK